MVRQSNSAPRKVHDLFWWPGNIKAGAEWLWHQTASLIALEQQKADAQSRRKWWEIGLKWSCIDRFVRHRLGKKLISIHAAGILKKKLFFVERCRYCQGFNFESQHAISSHFFTLSLLICNSQGLLMGSSEGWLSQRTFLLESSLDPSLSTMAWFPRPSLNTTFPGLSRAKCFNKHQNPPLILFTALTSGSKVSQQCLSFSCLRYRC